MDICTPKVSSTKQEFLSFLCNASIWSRSRVWDWWFYAKHKLSQLLNYTITSPTFHTIGPNNKQPKWDIDHVRRRRRGCCGWYLSRSWYACWGARNVRINNRAAATTGSPSRINYASYHLRRPALLEIFHLYGNWEQFVLFYQRTTISHPLANISVESSLHPPTLQTDSTAHDISNHQHCQILQ